MLTMQQWLAEKRDPTQSAPRYGRAKDSKARTQPTLDRMQMPVGWVCELAEEVPACARMLFSLVGRIESRLRRRKMWSLLSVSDSVLPEPQTYRGPSHFTTGSLGTPYVHEFGTFLPR